jgi:DNA-binding response OmpR family regulator
MQFDFHGKRILIVQDNPVVGAEFATALARANATVLGPCTGPSDADMKVMHSDLAILDIDAPRQGAFALADRLSMLDVPFVFVSAQARSVLPRRFATTEFIARPTSPEIVMRQLDLQSRKAAHPTIVELVPVLRQRARTQLTDPLAADRLVERTLRLAIADRGPLPSEELYLIWLQGLMDEALQSGKAQFLN